MSVMLNIVPTATKNMEENVVNAAGSRSQMRNKSSFNSIFAGISDTAEETKSPEKSENADAKTEETTGAGCIDALIGRLAMKLGQKEDDGSASGKITGQEEIVNTVSDNAKKVDESKSAGLLTAAERLARELADILEDGKSSLSKSQMEFLRGIVGELKQAVKGLTVKKEAQTLEDQNPGTEKTSEESLDLISARLRELMSAMYAAGIAVPGNKDQNTGIQGASEKSPGQPSDKIGELMNLGNSAGRSENNWQVKGEASSAKAAVGQGNYVMSEMHAGPSVESGEISSDPLKNEVKTPLPDKVSDGRETPGIRKIGDGKLSDNLAFSVSIDGKASNSAAGLDGTLPDSARTAFLNPETGVHGSPATGDYSKGSGGDLPNPGDKGKGNMFEANLNMGIRAVDMTVKAQDQIQNPVAELPKPVSHEQIMQQVREKLAAAAADGDTSRITLKLNPQELGELKITMKMENQNLKVDIVTENRGVRDALLHNMDSLKEILSRQNISMERFNVLTGSGYGNGENFRDWRQTAQNAQPNPFRRGYALTDEMPENNQAYLDSPDNSLIDLRL